MPASAPVPCYRRYPQPSGAARFVRREADDLLFLYDRLAGVTHILSPEAWMLLDAVEDVPCSVDLLLARVALDHDIDPAEDVHLMAAARLAELAEQGLIERL